MKSLLLICAGLLVGVAPLLSQEVSAGITGRVTDPSGAAIVGATVTAKDLDRGTQWPTKTNDEGIYAFPRVPGGDYEVRVEANGFKTYVQDRVHLDVNQRARLDIPMVVGGATETISVSAEAALLQTDTTQVGTVINPQTLEHAALISRNPLELTLTVPGAVSPNPGTMTDGRRSVGGGRPYVNGNREESNNFLLDGVDNNLTSENQTAYQPNPDAIEEFRMITNNASAEFGNFQGGVINIIIKSGTNQFHGSAFEDFRNDKLNANNWGNNWHTNPTVPRQLLRWNQFGGTIGGPIIKNKVFFFTDYQALRKNLPPVTTSFTVLPLDFRNGDFSRLLDPANGAIQLYNPFSADANGNRTPFANNQIPVTLFSPAIRKLINDPTLYPAPLSSAVRFNQSNSAGSYVHSDQGDFKLDWKISTKDDFTGRYSNGRQDNPTINSFPLIYNTFFIAPFQNGVVNWTRTIRPTLVNEVRIGVNDIMNQNGGADKGLGDIAQKIGIANAGSGLLALQGLTFANTIGNANVGTQQLFANSTFHYADNLTIIHGRHLIKTGAQLMRRRLDAFYSGNNGRTGFMNFNGQYTQGPNGKSPTSKAFSEADLVLGLPNDIGRGLSNGNTWGQRQNVWGIYVQDDWRVTNNLTLNLGVRWDYSSPWVEVKDRQVNFGLFSGQPEFAGQDGNSRGLYASYYKDFQPRLGFAWTPGANKKLVVRGAYTISSFMEGTGTNLRLTMNPPINSEFEAVYQSSLSNLPGSTVDQGFVGSRGAFVGANIRLWDPNVRPAEVQQWNLTTEYQLPGSNVLSVGYVGQHGTHLIAAMPFFQKQLVTPGQTPLPSPYLSGNPTLVSQITQISGTQSGANQKYNALQVALRKRFSFGIEYQLSYAWSHGMTDSIGYYSDSGQSGAQSAYMQNLYDRHSEWGPMLADAQHVFGSSFYWELPFGRGKKFGGSWAKPVDLAIGGWQMGGSFSAHTGFPLTIKTTDRSGTLARSARAQVIGKSNNSHIVGPGNHWLDLSGYTQPAAFTFGNAGPGTERGPGAAIASLSLGKQFRVTEHKWFELRGEAFNLANTPVFNSPVSQTITSATFGEISTATAERNIQLVLKFRF